MGICHTGLWESYVDNFSCFISMNVLCQISNVFDCYVELLNLVKNNLHCSVGMFQQAFWLPDLNFL